MWGTAEQTSTAAAQYIQTTSTLIIIPPSLHNPMMQTQKHTQTRIIRMTSQGSQTPPSCCQPDSASPSARSPAGTFEKHYIISACTHEAEHAGAPDRGPQTGGPSFIPACPAVLKARFRRFVLNQAEGSTIRGVRSLSSSPTGCN